ncbi:MAG: hypothetical protein D6718_00725 [Acidobacteria bacterium]|nr:MAG: hypothetical protein D6718_00725 [Acidobacteriota bacterium]
MQTQEGAASCRTSGQRVGCPVGGVAGGHPGRRTERRPVLNKLRENLKYTKWILVLVALSFALFFGVDWWNSRGRGPMQVTWVATVGGEPIGIGECQARGRQIETRYRRLMGDQYSKIRDQFDPMIAAREELIRSRLIEHDARRLGLRVSDAEVSQAIRGIRLFQNEDGSFVGMERYRRMLMKGYFPPYRDPAAFEAAIRRDLLVEKWQQLIAASVVVTPEQVKREFERRNEKVSLEYLVLPYEEAAPDVNPKDAELAAWYEAHRDRYSQGEARRASFVAVTDKAVASTIDISDEEIEAYYQQNRDQYKRPEQRRARHILVRVEPDADEAAIEEARRKAQAIRERIDAGEDFAALARKLSEDEGTRDKGGDLGFFARGQMVPAFEEAVFGMSPGEVAGPVRTRYGFHVIRLEEVQEEGLQPLEEVKEQIRAQLRFPRLREARQELGKKLAELVESGKSLADAASELGLEVQDSGLIPRSGTFPGLGPVPELVAKLFELEPGQASGLISVPTADVVMVLEEVVPDYLPPFEENRARVLADYRREKAAEVAEQRLSRALKAAKGDLGKAAQRLGISLHRTPEPVIRGTALEGLGRDPEVERLAFTTATGEVAGPIRAASGVVALKVTAHEKPDPEQLTEQWDAIVGALKAPRVQRLISSRLETLAQEIEVVRNPALEAAKG